MSDIERLTDFGDQNYALRVAVQQAYDKIVQEIYDWDKDKTARSYDNLYEGKLELDWKLEHPTGIEPREFLPAPTGPCPPIDPCPCGHHMCD